MGDVTDLHGTEMSERAIGSFLRGQGTGLLALASGSDAYAVPISFGYDDGPRRLYFDLVQFGEESRKVDYAADTTEACFVTYDVQSRFDWRSVIARGPLSDVPESDHEQMDVVMADNAWFPSLFPPTEPMTGVRRTVMRLQSVTGRVGESGDE